MRPATGSPSRLRFLGLAGAMALGAVLLFAAWSKAIDPEAFAEQIRIEGLDFLLPAKGVAFAALGLELALGGALLLGIRRLWVLLPAATLVAFFLFLNARAYWRFLYGTVDEAAACGCFGHLLERTPAEAFWQDLMLLLPALLLAFVGRGRGGALPARRLVLTVVVTLAGLLLAWRAPDLPLDDLATRLRPGVEVADLCAGSEGDPERICLDALVPELEKGEHWVVLAELEEEAFLAAVDRLHEHAVTGGEPPVWVVSAATPEALQRFAWQWGAAFDVRLAPEALVRPLHRRLPRSFKVHSGRVEETMAGIPPLQESFEPRASAVGD